MSTELTVIPVTLLWHSHYWDGPISGVCDVNGRICWFNTDCDPLSDEERQYLVYNLTDTEVARLRHPSFVNDRYDDFIEGKDPIGIADFGEDRD